jgi:hypothetical protein
VRPPLARPAARAALCILLAALACEARALSIRIAPLAILDPALEGERRSLHPELDLLKRLDATPLTGSVDFAMADKAASAPVSFLDAARLCELRGYPYLLYGYLQRQESIYSSELKLLSRDGKRIEASFVARDDDEHYDRLIADIAGKVADYFLSELAVAPGTRREESEENFFELPFAAGYWIPTGDWAEGTMGLFSIDAGLRFVPHKPIGGFKSRPFYIGIGLWAEYALGKNKPEYESAYLHRFEARVPFELFLELQGGSAVGLALGGIAEFDILSQQRKYGDRHSETTTAGGLLTSFFYRYPISDRIALGLELEHDLIFYKEPLYTFAPRLRFEYSFAKKGTANAE